MGYFNEDINEMIIDNNELNEIINNDIQDEFFICENIKIYKKVFWLANKLDIYIAYCDVKKLLIKINKECMKVIKVFDYWNNHYAKELLFWINDSQVYFKEDDEKLNESME